MNPLSIPQMIPFIGACVATLAGIGAACMAALWVRALRDWPW